MDDKTRQQLRDRYIDGYADARDGRESKPDANIDNMRQAPSGRLKTSIKVNVDMSELDEAVAKAERLVELEPDTPRVKKIRNLIRRYTEGHTEAAKVIALIALVVGDD